MPKNIEITVNYEELDFYLVTEYYDIPLKGYCKYKGLLYYFEAQEDFFAKPPENVEYNLAQLTSIESMKVHLLKMIDHIKTIL